MLFPDLQRVWEGFWRLHQCRTGGGMGVNPIQINDIVIYGERVLKIGLGELEDFIDYVSALDSVMLNHLYKKDSGK